MGGRVRAGEMYFERVGLGRRRRERRAVSRGRRMVDGDGPGCKV